ncbi:Hypothetical protein Minf_0752 [Methylacidiphilum infernorum V4]|uniref:Uncharacterized protein n=1 Tax=Methylacidiphilum infernorum (isolate V4) TaxID=481448 RepID=B3E0Q3_METI4|nr:Hypothetical protein Minf_0752 [Methylacidiphilum infernorum V4]
MDGLSVFWGCVSMEEGKGGRLSPPEGDGDWQKAFSNRRIKKGKLKMMKQTLESLRPIYFSILFLDKKRKTLGFTELSFPCYPHKSENHSKKSS